MEAGAGGSMGTNLARGASGATARAAALPPLPLPSPPPAATSPCCSDLPAAARGWCRRRRAAARAGGAGPRCRRRHRRRLAAPTAAAAPPRRCPPAPPAAAGRRHGPAAPQTCLGGRTQEPGRRGRGVEALWVARQREHEQAGGEGGAPWQSGPPWSEGGGELRSTLHPKLRGRPAGVGAPLGVARSRQEPRAAPAHLSSSVGTPASSCPSSSAASWRCAGGVICQYASASCGASRAGGTHAQACCPLRAAQGRQAKRQPPGAGRGPS